MSIFQIKGNINHNGTVYKAGEFIEAEVAEFEHLVKLGAMRLFPEAKTTEEAQAVVESEKSQKENSQAVIGEENNTWAAKKDGENTWQPNRKPAEAPKDEAVAPVAPVATENTPPADQPQADQVQADPAKPAEVAPETNTPPADAGADL